MTMHIRRPRHVPPRLPGLVRLGGHGRRTASPSSCAATPTTRTARASCARRSTASSTACTAPTGSCTRCAASAPKGDGRFEQITWDEALAEIAARLHDVIDRARRRGDPAVQRRRQPEPAVDDGPRRPLLPPPRRQPPACAAICGPTVGAGVRDDERHRPRRSTRSSCATAELILLWGTNTRLTNRHLWPTIEAARADGAKVVVIDPIRTITAEAADQFVQPLPGTDIALMLAMMHVLIRDGLVDDDVGRRPHARLRRARRPRRRLDARAGRRRSAALDADDHRGAGPRLRHDPPGRDPHADRRRAPRERGDVLPHARRACRRSSARGATAAAGCRAASARTRTRSIDDAALTRPDLLAGRVPRWLNMSRLGEVLTDPTLDPPVAGDGRVELQPAGHRAQRRADPPRPGPRRPVHRRPRAVPHRHGPLRRHRAAGDDADRGHRRRRRRGATCGWAGTRPRSSRSARRVSNTELFRRLAGAMGFTEPALFDDDETLLAQALGRRSTSTSCGASAGCGCRTPRTAGRAATGVFPTAVGQGRAASASARSRWASRRCRRSSPPREGPHGDAELVARYPLQLMTPKHHTRFLNSGYSHAAQARSRRGRRRSSSSTPPTPPPAASPTATAPRCSTTGPRVELPVRISEPAAARRRRRSRSAGGRRQHPDGTVANALTNDTLTDWGGGVAFSDTLVEVERRRERDPRLIAAHRAAEQGRRVASPAWQAS